MNNQFSRTELLIGTDAVNKLQKAHIALFGLGGVGGYVLEALARSGVKHFDLVDNDKVSLTNLNRQIIALHSSLDKPKTQAAKDRIVDINKNANINLFDLFLDEKTIEDFDFKKYDYVIDAIDTVKSKILLIEKAKENNIPIICAMGAGNKLCADKFVVSDISKTMVCPLARVIRQELKKRKIKNVKVVYSTEPPIKPKEAVFENSKQIPASICYAPAVMGLIMASEVIKDLIK